ncbi:MAG: DnaB-like helicase N-terminal domain-containing protein [Burkholderiales bacterium]
MSTVPFSRSRNVPLDKPLPNNLDAERAVLGAVLLDRAGAAVKAAAEILLPSDFFLDQHRRIYMQMLTLAAAKKPVDTLTLVEELREKESLEAAGGPAYIASLLDGVPHVSNVAHYAKIVREKSELRQIIHSTHAIQQRALEGNSTTDVLIDDFTVAVKQIYQRSNVGLTVAGLAELVNMDLHPLEFVVDPILPVQGIGMVHAWRGVGKTNFTLEIAYCVAAGLERCFTWLIPQARPVLYIDGEMDAPSLQQRVREIVRGHGARPLPESLWFITPDLQKGHYPNIATKEGQSRIEDQLHGGELVVFDNLSALSPASTDAETETWVLVQEWLLRLRRGGYTSLFLHHSGKGGTQRGWSGREDVLNVTIGLREPADYSRDEGLRCEVYIEKLRQKAHGETVQPFELQMRSTDGATDWLQRPLKHIIERRAFEMFGAGMKPREIAEDLRLSRFQVYRLQRKFQSDPLRSIGGGDF